MPWPWAALIVSFPLAHSMFLTEYGERVLVWLIPGPHGQPLATIYAIIANTQLQALFALWTPPIWAPDQLALAASFTAFCPPAPRLKEWRFAARYGARFDRYRARGPDMMPHLTKDRPDAQ